MRQVLFEHTLSAGQIIRVVQSDLTTEAVSSVEPSSTMISSKSPKVWSSTLSIALPIRVARLYVGRITLTAGGFVTMGPFYRNSAVFCRIVTHWAEVKAVAASNEPSGPTARAGFAF